MARIWQKKSAVWNPKISYNAPFPCLVYHRIDTAFSSGACSGATYE